MPEAFPLTAVAIMIHVSDVARAIDWYTRLLGRAPDRAFFPNFQE